MLLSYYYGFMIFQTQKYCLYPFFSLFLRERYEEGNKGSLNIQDM